MGQRARNQASVPEGWTWGEAPRTLLLATLLGIFLLGLALRLHGVDASSLWWDEVKTVTAARLEFLAMLDFQARDSVHPPLLYVVTGFLMALLGASDFVVRLQAALFGALAVLAAYKLGALLWTKREGVIAAFLVAINVYLIRYSQEARHYSLMVLLAILALIFLLKALRDDRRMMWLLFALCTSLNIYTHYYAFLILPSEFFLAIWVIVHNWKSTSGQPTNATLHSAEPVNAGHHSGAEADPPASADSGARAPWPSPTPRRQALHLVAVLFLVAILYLPWLPFMSQQFVGRMIEFGGVALEQPARAELSPTFFGQVLHEYTTLGGVSLAFFLALFVLGLASSRAGYILLFGLWIAVPFLFPFAVRSSHFFEIRYAICVVPIMLLVVARGIARLSDLLVQGLPVTKKNRRWGLGVDAFLALGIFGALSVAPIRDYYLIQKPDYRAVARYLASQVSTEDIVLADGYGYLYHDSMTVIRNLSYYLDRSAIAEMPILTVEPGLAEAVAGLDTARDGKVWTILLSSDFTGADTEGVVATTPFEGLAVVQLRRPSGDRYQDTLVMLRTLTGLLRAPEARFDVYLALAEFYAALGNQDEVDTLVGLATSSRPVERSAHLHLAVYHAKQGRSEDAVEEYLAYLQAPSARPDWWREREAYWGLAVAYEQLDNLEQAVPAYKEVLQLDPSYWRAYRNLGSLYLRLGEPGEALSAYGRAVDLQPQNSNLHLVLGRAYQSLDQIEEATLAYQQAVAIDPNNNVAKAQLTSLSELTGKEIPHPLFRSLAGEINLLGYDIRPVALEAGRPLRVTLWWQALAPMDSDYSVFIHVLAPDGWMYAQQDSLLQHEGLPTSAWRVGLLVRGSYQLELPVEASAGSQAVLVGLYHWETGERLAVWDSEGVRAPEDAILLTEFTLQP